jgi:hypothetical protein
MGIRRADPNQQGPCCGRRCVPNPTAAAAQEHKEFWPLVARRSHALGGRPTIEDGGLRAAWAELLRSLARQPAPPPAEKLKAAVFLLAQVPLPSRGVRASLAA